jgi:hypothetical protein
MKSSLRSRRQELRRVSNGVIIGAMLPPSSRSPWSPQVTRIRRRRLCRHFSLQDLTTASPPLPQGPTATVDGRCADSASGGTTWLVLWHPLLRLRFFTCYLLSWRLCLMRAISNPYR